MDVEIVWTTKVDNRFIVEVCKNSSNMIIYDMHKSGNKIVEKKLRNTTASPERIIRWQNLCISELDKILSTK